MIFSYNLLSLNCTLIKGFVETMKFLTDINNEKYTEFIKSHKYGNMMQAIEWSYIKIHGELLESQYLMMRIILSPQLKF